MLQHWCAVCHVIYQHVAEQQGNEAVPAHHALQSSLGLVPGSTCCGCCFCLLPLISACCGFCFGPLHCTWFRSCRPLRFVSFTLSLGCLPVLEACCGFALGLVFLAWAGMACVAVCTLVSWLCTCCNQQAHLAVLYTQSQGLDNMQHSTVTSTPACQVSQPALHLLTNTLLG